MDGSWIIFSQRPEAIFETRPFPPCSILSPSCGLSSTARVTSALHPHCGVRDALPRNASHCRWAGGSVSCSGTRRSGKPHRRRSCQCRPARFPSPVPAVRFQGDGNGEEPHLHPQRGGDRLEGRRRSGSREAGRDLRPVNSSVPFQIPSMSGKTPRSILRRQSHGNNPLPPRPKTTKAATATPVAIDVQTHQPKWNAPLGTGFPTSRPATIMRTATPPARQANPRARAAAPKS